MVVATHNRAERLPATLEGLRRQTLAAHRFEVVIVDDGSSDATPACSRPSARGQLPLAFVRHHEGRRPGAARNRGWHLAAAPMIAFTDDDCVPTPGWLEALLAGGHRRDARRPGPHAAGSRRDRPLDPFAKTMDITGPTPALRDLQHRLPARPARAAGGLRRDLPGARRRGLRPRLARQGGRRRRAFAPDALVHHAVFPRRPREALKDALMATDDVAPTLNPDLRENLTQGVFYDRSHPLMMQAAYALGSPGATRRPWCSPRRTR